MFFFVFFAIGFLLTAFLSPKAKVENARASNLSDFNFPRADEGDPVARIYGTVKFKAPNTIWAGDFEAKPITKKQKTGLFSSKKVTVGYKYFVGLDLAICLGPDFRFNRIWAGKYELWNGCLSACVNTININRPNLFGGEDKNGGFVGDITLYCGDFDQPQDTYLAAKVDPKVPRYTGVAHMVFRKCYFGNSPQIEPIYIEGSMFTNTLGTAYNIMPNGLDINPIEALYDIYCSDWGNLDINASLINAAQWRAIAQKVHAEGNGISLNIGKSNTGGDVTKEILRQVGMTLYQNPSTGLFELVLIRNDYTVDDLPVFGPSEIKTLTNFTKVLWEETVNTVRVKFTDRAQGYKENTVALAQDSGNIRFQRRIKAIEITMPGIYVADLANQIAARELSQQNVPLYQAELSLNREATVLTPGQAFVLSWPEYGIVRMVMRVRKFGLGTLKDGTVTMSVVQDEFALDTVIMAPPVSTGYVPDETTPLPVLASWFELPYWLTVASGLSTNTGDAHLAVIAAAPSRASLGYNVVTTYTDSENAELLNREPYRATALLASPLGRFQGFNDFGVQPTISIKDPSDPDLFSNVDGPDMRSGHGLMLLNGELLNYTDFEVEDDGTITLYGVHRALVDTGWIGGATDDRIYFFDAQNGFLPDAFGGPPLLPKFVGKVQDVTTAGSLELAGLTEYTIIPTGRADLPYAPDGVRLDDLRTNDEARDVASTSTVTWLERNRLTAPAVLKFEDDDTETPEVGTEYVVAVEDPNGDEVFRSDPVAVPSYDLVFTDAMSGHSVILVYAKLGASLSYAASPFPVTVRPIDGSITVDGDLVRIDGARVTIDG